MYRLKRDTISEKLRYLKKYLYTKLYTFNKSLLRVLILNDEEGVDFLNKQFRTSIFKMLVDPIPNFAADGTFNTFLKYGVSLDKKILLHPGSIHPRKGTFEIIEAVDSLGAEDRNKYVILIVGKSSESLEEQIRLKIGELRNKETKVIYDNCYLSNEQLAALFRDSYAVLIPYKNVESSSGILGHAATFRLPVLAPNVGLLGSLVSTYSLGVLINGVSSNNIADGIHQLEAYKPEENKIVDFCSSRTTKSFANTILEF